MRADDLGDRAFRAPLYWLLLATALCHIPYNAGRVVGQMALLRMGESGLSVGVMASLYAAPFVLLSIAVGKWIDRRGPRSAIFLGPLLLACGTVVLWSGRYDGYLLAGLLIGAGFCIWYVFASAAIGAIDGDAVRGSSFGFFAFTFSVSSMIAAPISGLGASAESADAAMLAVSASALAALILVALKAPVWSASGHARAATSESRPDRPPVRPFAFGYLMLICAVGAVAWDLFLFGVPIVTAKLRIADSLGWILGALSVGAAIGRLLAAFVSRSASLSAKLTVSLLISAIGLLGMLAQNSLPLFLCASAIGGLGLGLLTPYVLDAVATLAPGGRLAQRMGWVSVILGVSAVAVPLAAGALSDRIDMRHIFAATGVAAAVLAAGAMAMFGFAALRAPLTTSEQRR